MEQVPLTAQKRTVVGRKVKNLRKQGIIPAHVFGNKVKTISIQVNGADFLSVYEKVGETGIIDLTINGLSSDASAKSGGKKPVLVRNIQTHPVTDDTLHIDFYQVNLTEKVKVNVPLEIIGEAPAVEKKIGLLLTPISEVEVEALPGDLPDNVEIDVSKLGNIGDEIKVKDVNVDRSKIQIITDEEQIVAQIGELVTKEMEAIEAEVQAEQAEAAAEQAAAEGPPAEGEVAEVAEGAEAAAESEETGKLGDESKGENLPADKKPEENTKE